MEFLTLSLLSASSLRKNYKKFLVKIVIQTPYVKFDAFSGRNASFSLIKQSDEK